MKTLHEINQEGIQVLIKNLGTADAIRFLRQHGHGYGDYTAERHKWLGRLTKEQILRDIRALQRPRRKSMA